MRDMLDGGAPVPGAFSLKGRHVLVTLIVFFGVVFAVNGYMLVRALSTHSGVVAIEPYRKGLAYNERILADDRQSALGWSDTIAFTAPGLLTVTMAGRDTSPVSGLRLSASAERPSTAIADRALQFREEAPGRYVAPTGALEPGTWLVSLEVRTPDQPSVPVYRAKRRLWLKP